MSNENSKPGQDWRLMGQENYLKSVTLSWRKYARYSEKWDQDHCEFCSAKFMVEDYPDVLHEGYCTENQYRWICQKCFEDFKEQFDWKVIKSKDG